MKWSIFSRKHAYIIDSNHRFISFLVTDSPINSTNPNQRKIKSNGIDVSQQTKSCQNMKSIISPKPNLIPNSKRITPDYSEMERNNIYAETPPKSKSNSSSVSPPAVVNGTNHYMPILQTRRAPKILMRNDLTQSVNGGTSTSSVSSFSTATCSSQSTTPSNSFRQDTTSIMTRSADASSSCGLISQTKNGTNSIKSKSIYDIDTSTIDRSRQQTKENLNNNNNSKCINGNFVPLQSVKEDECLEVENNRNRKCFKVRYKRLFFSPL
jgi:hypothetical protein